MLFCSLLLVCDILLKEVYGCDNISAHSSCHSFLQTFADVFHSPGDLPNEMVFIDTHFSVRKKVWARST